jgi:hypothetical protein
MSRGGSDKNIERRANEKNKNNVVLFGATIKEGDKRDYVPPGIPSTVVWGVVPRDRKKKTVF